MAAAAFDIKALVGQNTPQSSRDFHIPKNIKFSEQALTAGQDAEFITIPANTLIFSCTPILKVAEGAAATLHVGTEGAPSLLVNAFDLNGVVDSVKKVDKLGLTLAAAASVAEEQSIIDKIDEIIGVLGDNGLHGWFFAADTNLRVTAASGNPSGAEVLLLFKGLDFS